jgi:hypothetical protein
MANPHLNCKSLRHLTHFHRGERSLADLFPKVEPTRIAPSLAISKPTFHPLVIQQVALERPPDPALHPQRHPILHRTLLPNPLRTQQRLRTDLGQTGQQGESGLGGVIGGGVVAPLMIGYIICIHKSLVGSYRKTLVTALTISAYNASRDGSSSGSLTYLVCFLLLLSNRISWGAYFRYSNLC